MTGDTQLHSIRAHGGQPTCFRITGVPSHWGTDELEERLKSIDPDIDLTNVDLSKFPACSYWTKTSTTLLRLNRNTIYFDGWKQSEEKQILFREQGRTVRLNIDKDFYGLTPLNNPKIPITAEFVPLHTLKYQLADISSIIAITGLAGHAFGSWQNRGTDAMWLYDFLPEQFESARIMTYGYNSSLLEPNGARLTDHIKNFTEELCNARYDCPVCSKVRQLYTLDCYADHPL